MTMHIGQSSINPVVPHRQSRVVDTQLIQQRRMNIVNLCGIIAVQRFVAPFIRLAVTDPAFDSTAA